jgi:hypothetical protein
MRGGLLVAVLTTRQRVGDMLPCSSSLPFSGPFLQKIYLIGIVIKLLNIINTLKTQKKFWKALKCFEALAEGTTSTWQPQSQDNERGYVGEVEEADMFYK